MAHGLSRIAAAALAAAVGFCGARARAQDETVLSPAYRAVLSRYASGQAQAAVAELAAWPEARLRVEMTRLAALCRAVRSCGSAACAARGLWESLPLRAALMLHADAALADSRAGRSARLSESAVAELARMLADDPRHAAFVRRVLEAMVAVHHLEMRWGAALDWGDRALKLAPDSVPVLLAMAAIEEMTGALVVPVESRGLSTDPVTRSLIAGVEAGREAAGHYRTARDLARRALAADPASVEARLRLGRLLWRLDELAAAKAELEPVARSGQPASLAFLAQLFLGGVLEQEGRLEEATAAYEAAVAGRPKDQSAAVALSELRHRRGDLAGARAALLSGLSTGGRRRENDPYWDYPFGASVDAAARLEALRREVSP